MGKREYHPGEKQARDTRSFGPWQTFCCLPTIHRGVSVNLAGYADPACYLQISRAHEWAQARATWCITEDLWPWRVMERKQCEDNPGLLWHCTLSQQREKQNPTQSNEVSLQTKQMQLVCGGAKQCPKHLGDSGNCSNTHVSEIQLGIQNLKKLTRSVQRNGKSGCTRERRRWWSKGQTALGTCTAMSQTHFSDNL